MRTFLNRLAYRRLCRAMQRDQDLAWAWHCQIAMSLYDQALSAPADVDTHKLANNASRVAMGRVFGVDVAEHPAWTSFEEKWKTQ